jgi:hypothetical protein
MKASSHIGMNIAFSCISCCTMPSWSAYITMNGVMMPGVSAGSSHVGASVTCTPQVICPSGAAAAGAAKPAIARVSAATSVPNLRGPIIEPSSIS